MVLGEDSALLFTPCFLHCSKHQHDHSNSPLPGAKIIVTLFIAVTKTTYGKEEFKGGLLIVSESDHCEGERGGRQA